LADKTRKELHKTFEQLNLKIPAEANLWGFSHKFEKLKNLWGFNHKFGASIINLWGFYHNFFFFNRQSSIILWGFGGQVVSALAFTSKAAGSSLSENFLNATRTQSSCKE
jgi:hypothetical protein